MKKIAIVLLVLFFISCAAIRVHYDYDKATNFSNYITYNYYPEMETGLNNIETKRFINALDANMQVKGFLLSEEPDFYIAISSKTFQGPQRNNIGVGLGGSVGGLSIGIPVGRPLVERELQFDFIDSQNQVLFWTAISESTLKEEANPEVKEHKIQQIIEKVLDKYPPK